MEASSHLLSSGFFGLLRNLRSAKRAGPDFGRLSAKLVCNCYGAYTTSDLASLGHRTWPSGPPFAESLPRVNSDKEPF